MERGFFNMLTYFLILCYNQVSFGNNINVVVLVFISLQIGATMEAINLILFGFIVYTALIVVPSIWEELTTEA